MDDSMVKAESDLDTSFLDSSFDWSQSQYHVTVTPTITGNVASKLVDSPVRLSTAECYKELGSRLRAQAEWTGDSDEVPRTDWRSKVNRVLYELVVEITHFLATGGDLTVLAVLDFCQVLFQDVSSASRTVYLERHSVAKSFFASFRSLLLTNQANVEIKQEVLRVLLQALKSLEIKLEVDNPACPPSRLVDFLLSADLDHCFVECFTEKPLFNSVIQLFSILIPLPGFPQDRISTTVKQSLRVAHLIIAEDQMDRQGYFGFLWTAFSNLTTPPSYSISDSVSKRIYALFSSLFFNWGSYTPPVVEPCVIFHFGQFLSKVTNPQEFLDLVVRSAKGSLILQLLREPSMTKILAATLLENEGFISSLNGALGRICRQDDILVSEEDLGKSLEIIEILMDLVCPGGEVEIKTSLRIKCSVVKLFKSIFSFGILDLSLKFLRKNLHYNFANPLVKIHECSNVTGEVGGGGVVRNLLDHIEILLQNRVVLTKLTPVEDEGIWKTFVELHEFAERHRRGDVVVPLYESPVHKRSTQTFFRAYLSGHSVDRVSPSFLTYLETYARFQGNDLLQDELTTGLVDILGQSRLGLLQVIGDWLDAVQDSGTREGYHDDGGDGSKDKQRKELGDYLKNLKI